MRNPHWHIVCWLICFGILSRLAGRVNTGVLSPFVKFLQLVFRCEIDVQVGNGRLNYINGHLAKDRWGGVGISSPPIFSSRVHFRTPRV